MKAYTMMLIRSVQVKLPAWAWTNLSKLLGDPPELLAARSQLTEWRQRFQAEQAARAEHEKARAELQSALEQVREERLQWMAREASTRKELLDTQERGKDLLEQVVRLTHQQRQVKQDLLDHQFKTETTPLERNRFELELTEARGRVKRAEDQAKQAEEAAAQLSRKVSDLKPLAEQAKDLESKLAWAKRQTETLNQALAASLEKVKDLEMQVRERRIRRPEASRPVRPAKYAGQPSARPAKNPARRTYHKPSMQQRSRSSRTTPPPGRPERLQARATL